LAEKVRVSAEEVRISAEEDSLQHCLSSHHVVLFGERFQALLTSFLLQVTNVRIIKLAQKTTFMGISKRGASGICIFEGIMVKEVYVDILERMLLPFIHDVSPDGHRFMQDNDPKCVLKLAKNFLEPTMSTG